MRKKNHVTTTSDIEFIKKNYKRMTTRVIAEELDMSLGTVEKLKIKLGLKYVFQWTEDRIQFLKDNIGKYTADELAEMLGTRGNYTIYYMAKKLGLENSMKKRWSIEEDDFIIKHYNGTNSKMIAEALHRTVYATRTHIVKMGLAPKKKVR